MNDRESYDLFSRCADGTIVITALPEKKNYRYRTTDAEGMYRKVVELGKDTNVLYISVNPRGDDLPDGARGGDDDVNQLFAIVADCDVFGEAHKEKELPPDKCQLSSGLRRQKNTMIIRGCRQNPSTASLKARQSNGKRYGHPGQKTGREHSKTI